MSYTEKHLGRLRKVDLQGKSLEEWCKEEFGENEKPKCKKYERHMPRQLEGIRAAKEGEEETKEQKEKRSQGKEGR